MGLKLKDLADRLGGEVQGNGEVMIERVATIEHAGDGEIAFLSNDRYESYARTTKAAAIIVSPQKKSLKANLLITKNPYLAFARAVAILMEEKRPGRPGIHPSAVIAEGVKLGGNVEIGPRVVIEEGAVIGDAVIIMAGAYIGPGVSVDKETVIHPNASLYRKVRIGKRCIIHSNVVIGSDGFAWAPNGVSYERIPQVGATVVGDDVSIGAGSIINRGALNDTTIGSGTKIDSLVIISHNVEIGKNCLFVSQVGVSGSVKIGNHCTFGGQVGIAGHLTIGDNVQVAAQAGVNRDLAPDKAYLGAPAKPINEMRRAFAAFSRLPELRNEIKRVQKRMAKITAILERDVGSLTGSEK